MRNVVLWVACSLLGACSADNKETSVIPDFIHGVYSVESLLSEAELSNPNYGAFEFIYLMAAPEWSKIDFDLPQERINAYADSFDYRMAPGNMPLVPQMIEKAHAEEANVLLCFGGQKEFRTFLEKPERLAKFTKYIVRLIDRNDYDGVDIDWEISIDKELHAGMMQDLRDQLDSLGRKNRRTYYVTTALSIDHVYDQALADRLIGAVDWINIMSYDMCDGIWGTTPSHHTSMESLRSKLENWKLFDRSKLCLGLANYGFYYKGLEPGQKADAPLSEYGRYITYKEFIPWMSEGWVEEYDPAAEVSYYFSPDREEFVTMDSPSSILNKIEWIQANGFRGAFWWEFHHDYLAPDEANPQGSHYLIDLVTDYLKR
ncbi:glycosyl hydrolase family 18 protein [Alistipes provencensis]|uniref:glycosyl hydrolase family 18 protein n=1 Tax=Alistipes provencensis TaxID=1816676 RepID=UPI00138FCD0C|nr:glycoside hydrolase family 18 protein [Alistipes provencensis]